MASTASLDGSMTKFLGMSSYTRPLPAGAAGSVASSRAERIQEKTIGTKKKDTSLDGSTKLVLGIEGAEAFFKHKVALQSRRAPRKNLEPPDYKYLDTKYEFGRCFTYIKEIQEFGLGSN
mmetsp:Transcript_20823/g.70904  ORF Transcript_20823/g.70904 Transcript_20823/m.70904 type:complete len:120 (+) Transcript_20823:39-398(+)